MLTKIGIKSIRKLETKAHVYDLSVDGNHNFFIGETETLTHNCDYLTANAQAILRNLMETFSGHCRFILTCNYIEKIIDPIQSRCQTEAITPPSKKDVCVHIAKILQNESITFDPKDVLLITDKHYPDIRKCINTIQQQSKSGKLTIDVQNMLDSDFKHRIIEELKSKDGGKDTFTKIRQLIADNRVQDFTDCYRSLYDHVDEYSNGKTTTCIMLIADHQYRDSLIIDHEIGLMAAIINILAEIK